MAALPNAAEAAGPSTAAQLPAPAEVNSEVSELSRLHAVIEFQETELARFRAGAAVAGGPPPAGQSALSTALGGIVDPTNLECLSQQLGGVPQHLQVHQALQILNSTGALNFNRAYSNINTKNLEPGLLLSPPKAVVNPLNMPLQYV